MNFSNLDDAMLKNAEQKEMLLSDTTAVESRIRDDVNAGKLDRAAAFFIRRYGGEILGFLVGRAGDAAVGADVFSEFTVDLWRGLPGFQWRTSIRSWGYTLARNAFFRYLNAKKRDARNVPLPRDSEFQIAAAKVRSTTLMHLRTEVKSKMRELRERLPQDDQILLVLRIDRKLSWDELAAVMSGKGDGVTSEERRRLSARFRQRFQGVKERLRNLAVAEGLLAHR